MKPLLTLAFLLMAGSAWGDEATSPLASDPTRVCVVSVGSPSERTCVKSVTKEEYAAMARPGRRATDGAGGCWYAQGDDPIWRPVACDETWTKTLPADDFIITWCGVVSHGDPAHCAHSATSSTAMEHDSVTCDSLHPVGSGGCLPGSSAPARRTYSVDDVNQMREIERHKAFDLIDANLDRSQMDWMMHHADQSHPEPFVTYGDPRMRDLSRLTSEQRFNYIESRVQTDILAGIGPDELEKAK